MLKDIGEDKQTRSRVETPPTKILGNLSVTSTWFNAKDLVYEFMAVLRVVNIAIRVKDNVIVPALLTTAHRLEGKEKDVPGPALFL